MDKSRYLLLRCCLNSQPVAFFFFLTLSFSLLRCAKQTEFERAGRTRNKTKPSLIANYLESLRIKEKYVGPSKHPTWGRFCT